MPRVRATTQVLNMLPSDVQAVYNPLSLAHYDHYVVYHPHQVHRTSRCCMLSHASSAYRVLHA